MQDFLHGLRDITPKELNCVIGACPTIFETDSGFVIVGNNLDGAELPGSIAEKVGAGERAVYVPKALLRELQRPPRE